MRIQIRFRIQLINFDVGSGVLFDVDADPDADPGYQNHKDLCGSGSTTLHGGPGEQCTIVFACYGTGWGVGGEGFRDSSPLQPLHTHASYPIP
jgi:hypothetical protein